MKLHCDDLNKNKVGEDQEQVKNWALKHKMFMDKGNWDQYREDKEREKEIANCWTGWRDQNSEMLRQEISNTSSTKIKEQGTIIHATCTNTV